MQSHGKVGHTLIAYRALPSIVERRRDVELVPQVTKTPHHHAFLRDSMATQSDWQLRGRILLWLPIICFAIAVTFQTERVVCPFRYVLNFLGVLRLNQGPGKCPSTAIARSPPNVLFSPSNSLFLPELSLERRLRDQESDSGTGKG
ncbi:hypothetical protein M231_05822 [Tremella mesenterica]|uniref:Uncharacterized protein n=1 Tax=Tremella mesenterica TaxID=5217 RepID=A0A4Q1BH63_TREME|nr:hypothetical protein M231_05822 [Tremella mesenterica]